MGVICGTWNSNTKLTGDVETKFPVIAHATAEKQGPSEQRFIRIQVKNIWSVWAIFICQVCKTLIITLLTSHSSFISECSPIQLLRPIKHNIVFLTSFNANEPALQKFNASDMSWEHRDFENNMQLNVDYT